MKAIVAGATGFVGTNLVKRLLEKGYEVIVLVNTCNKQLPDWSQAVRVLECPSEKICNLDEICPDRDVDVFYNLAWHGTAGILRGDYDAQLRNIKYCCDSVVGAKKIGCKRYLYAGSIMEYEAMNSIPCNELKPSINTIYSVAKLTADFMLKVLANHTGLEYISVIISNIYGPNERSPRFLNTIIRKMMANERIEMTHGKQLYDFIYMSDAVEEIILCGEKGKPNHFYYIGNSKQRPLKEFVLEAKNIIKSDSKIDFGAVEFNGVELTYTEFDTGKVERELGYVPKVSFKQGIKHLQESMSGEC